MLTDCSNSEEETPVAVIVLRCFSFPRDSRCNCSLNISRLLGKRLESKKQNRVNWWIDDFLIHFFSLHENWGKKLKEFFDGRTFPPNKQNANAGTSLFWVRKRGIYFETLGGKARWSSERARLSSNHTTCLTIKDWLTLACVSVSREAAMYPNS